MAREADMADPDAFFATTHFRVSEIDGTFGIYIILSPGEILK